MAGLMVVELHDRAKRILKKHLNFLNQWRPHLSASYFKWCDDPPEAFQSSHGSASDHWSQFVLAIQNLSGNVVGILVSPRRKRPSTPYRLQALVVRRRALAVLAWLLRRELSEYQKNRGGRLR